ncbi:ABC transporter substrate-binding protein [Nocardioides bruguierae]|uniref:ABC transporter substrate-binding protein n=1 Tax=Nocardioides bruguierae TaxID=2945102 RepID=UPI0020217A5A|nr:ABC transporter substrate-binding protein [Nocardioides bruguierae]MCL8025320.1 ABC transporter substrate-binding protein [Nocardioides bruguierae]
MAFAAAPTTLDWSTQYAVNTEQIAWHIFETLYATDKDFVPRPMLATDYSVSDDGLVWTINLRTGVTFHNGDDMEPVDVVSSLERWMLVSDAGKELAPNVVSVEESGDSAVEITLKSPNANLISLLSSADQAAAIMPAEIADAAGTDLIANEDIIGTGPYQFDSWTAGDSVVLKRFEDYDARDETDWGGLAGRKEAYADTITYAVVSEQNVQISGVQTGQYDIATEISASVYDAVKDVAGTEAHVAPLGNRLALDLNHTIAPFDDVNMRLALDAALDQESVGMLVAGNEDLFSTDRALFPEVQSNVHTEAGTEGHVVGTDIPDVELAQEYLDKAGYDGETLKLLTTKDFPIIYQMSLAVQEQLNNVGMNVDLQVEDWPTYLKYRLEEPGGYTFAADYYQPTSGPEVTVWIKPTEWNGYTSDAMTAALDAWNNATDDDAKSAAMDQISEVYFAEMPSWLGPLITPVTLSNDQLQGYADYKNGLPVLWNSWKTD